MKNRKLLLAIPVLAVLPLAACHGGGKHAAAEASISASAHAFATSSQGQKDKAVVRNIGKDCFPGTLEAQVKSVKALVVSKAARAELDTCAGIPASRRAAFNAAVTKSAETAAVQQVEHHGHALATWLDTTLPDEAVQYGAK